MANQLVISVKLVTSSEWTQLDVVDPWIRVVALSEPFEVSHDNLSFSRPAPFGRYLPVLTPQADDPWLEDGRLVAGTGSVIRIDNPNATHLYPTVEVTAKVRMTLELPDGLGSTAYCGVRTIRFGTAKGKWGQTTVAFGNSRQPAFENRWAGLDEISPGWPHLLHEISAADLLAEAVAETTGYERDALVQRLLHALRREGDQPPVPAAESAEVLGRTLGMRRQMEAAIWDAVSARKVPL